MHIEAANLIGGPVPVFNSAQHTNIGVFIALELAHHIDQVFQQARPGDRAFLGHMPHQQGTHIACFRGGDQRCGNLAHLRNAPGAALNIRGRKGLHRVDHQHRRVYLLNMRQCGPQVGFARQVQGIGDGVDAVRTQLNLRGGFLTGHIQHVAGFRAGTLSGGGSRGVSAREGGGNIQQQGRFAHAGFASHQNHGTGHQSPAEHPVKFGVAGAHIGGDGRVYFADHLRRFLHAGCGTGARHGTPGGFLNRPPGLAFTASTHPFGGGPSAFGTAVGGGSFSSFCACSHGFYCTGDPDVLNT